ncbi:interleukin-12 receptor subunit beta-2-like [Scleropages formosus]|uniref:interleukin-12 receptor subunit beta-2-like n=1 Tax=Scleropages formosus TaxID=113540 RepID=UPI0010FAC8E3|nr:interleukin-12 receptor subunit beta-2-like [Scleropages formosus]
MPGGVRGVGARLALVTVTLLLRCAAMAVGKPCFTVSDAGPVVRLGSSFIVYCFFKEQCQHSIYRDRKQVYDAWKHNSTSIAVHVRAITENQTYTCKSSCCSEPCGLDLLAGHPPDVPYKLNCIQKGQFGNITCTWRSGRETYIGTLSKLWVKAHGDHGTATPVSFPGSGSVTFPIFGLQSSYSVWVNASNKLGTAVSPTLNFTLIDIVKPMPPNIMRVHCSSWQCVLYWSIETGAQLLQVRHRPWHGNWTTHPFMEKTQKNYSISGLQPFTKYDFQAKCKLSPTQGLWSEWSTGISSSTDEEAPQTNLDVWYIEKSGGSEEKLVTVLWKELSESEARGRILGYEMMVEDSSGRGIAEYATNNSAGFSVPCSSCNITVFAYNAKGRSPLSHLFVSHQRAEPPQNVVCQPLSNHSIAIFWKEPATARRVKGYLVEWQSAEGSRGVVRWKRTAPGQLGTVITENIQPFECYRVAVHALYEHGMRGTNFTEAYSWQSAPTLGPTPSLEVNGHSVTVTWSWIPWEHRRGCLKSYSIYVTGLREKTKQYGPIGISKRRYTISGLSFGDYRLFITGRTAMGEGPPGDDKVFFISSQEVDHKEDLVFVKFSCLGLVLLALGCLLHASSVRHRVSTCCYCLLPDAVPDPANSTWAKECKSYKGQMMLKHNLDLNSSILSDEEPETVEIQEIQDIWEDSIGKSGGCNGTFLPSVENSWTGFQQRTLYKVQPARPYIKSFSQESDSSDGIEASKSTDMTPDYISSHGLLEQDSEELEQGQIVDFFPSFSSPFSGPLVPFEGKLTLDVVKVDWSNLD